MATSRDWQSRYQALLTTPDEAVSRLKAGQRVVLPTLVGAPEAPRPGSPGPGIEKLPPKIRAVQFVEGAWAQEGLATSAGGGKGTESGSQHGEEVLGRAPPIRFKAAKRKDGPFQQPAGQIERETFFVRAVRPGPLQVGRLELVGEGSKGGLVLRMSMAQHECMGQDAAHVSQGGRDRRPLQVHERDPIGRGHDLMKMEISVHRARSAVGGHSGS